MSDKKAIGGAVPPPSSAPSFTPQPPPQANPPVPTPQPYGVMPGMPGSPYVIPGQTQMYPQGPPPTYDQTLTHPAIVGQHMYPPGTMYATGYPTYLGYPTYAPMQYYPSLGAYSYAMQPAQLRPTIMIPLMQDMENYMQYQLMGQKVKNLRLKTGVIPHIFTCQKPKINPPERHLPEKRRRLELIMDAEMEAATSSFAENRDDKVKEVFSEEPTAVQVPAENIESMTLTMDKNIQVNLRPKFRSKATNTREICTSIGLSPIKIPVVSIETSAPLKPPMKMLSLSESTISSVKSVIDEESDNLSQCSSSSSMEFVNEFQETEFKEHMLKGTLWSIERDPKLFLGLPLESYHLIKMLAIKAPLAVKNILITLKKIRLNDSFAILAINFGTSISNLSRIFDKSVVILSGLLQQLIYWPDRKNIRRHLPIPFRARYGNVVSLIDCLEIQIEKPSNPIHQALTWSEYKKGNTIKYLISCTPDGLVSFISKGYGGRATDVMILEDSGYVNQLQPGVAVMADRGFKNVVNILQQRDCVLIRPPSVSATTPSSADEVKQSKQIAALRVHVERVIGRLREFNMLLPHACVDNHLISRMDHVIVCACAIINCQKHLFKLQF